MASVVSLTSAQRALFFRYDTAAPLNPVERLEPAKDGVKLVRFWIDSTHSARVPGVLWTRSDSVGPCPLILIQHGAGGHKEADYIVPAARRWTQQGFTCAAIDASGHGERQQPADNASRIWRLPWARKDHAVQMAVDLMRTLDYLCTRPEVDGSRAGYLGFSMGSIMGVPFVGLDERVKSACFVIGGSMIGMTGGSVALSQELAQVETIIDPIHFAPLIAPRPVLMINGRRDETVPPEAAERLFAALDEPKGIEWYEGGHTGLRGGQFRQMLEFFQATL